MKKIFAILVIFFLYSGNIANATFCDLEDSSLDFLYIFGIPPQLIIKYSEADQIYFGKIVSEETKYYDYYPNNSYKNFEIGTFLPIKGEPDNIINYTSYVCDNFSFSKYGGIYIIYSAKYNDKYYINYSYSIIVLILGIIIRIFIVIFIIKLVKFKKVNKIKKIKNN